MGLKPPIEALISKQHKCKPSKPTTTFSNQSKHFLICILAHLILNQEFMLCISKQNQEKRCHSFYPSNYRNLFKHSTLNPVSPFLGFSITATTTLISFKNQRQVIEAITTRTFLHKVQRK